MIRLFAFSLFLLLIGCRSFKLEENYETERTTQTIENKHFKIGSEYFYRANISAYGNAFSGILAVKLLDANTQRVALTSDFGNTLFDFSFINKKLKINYIQENLNKKIIVNTLANDFQNLLTTEFVCNEKFINPKSIVWKCKNNNNYSYLFENEQQQIFKQINTRKSKKYTTFAFESHTENIEIQHHTLNIKIILTKI